MSDIPIFVRGRVHVANGFRDEEFVDQRFVFAEHTAAAEQKFEDYWIKSSNPKGGCPQYAVLEVEGFDTIGIQHE